MSLFTPADGILKTHLTWDELQKSVFKAFGADAKFGPNKDFKDIGAGNGLMSKICLISPDWKSELKNVPQIFIVKIFSQLSMVENQAIMENKDFINEELIKQFENYIKQCLATIMEKTQCLLDDMLYFHKRNMKIKKEESID